MLFCFIWAELGQKAQAVADDASDGSIVVTSPPNVAEKNEKIYKTFWHALPVNADKIDRFFKKDLSLAGKFHNTEQKSRANFVERFDGILN